MYLGVASVNAGLPVDTPAFTLNRLCGSGLQAIVSATQQIETGHCDIAVGGGVECMKPCRLYLNQPALGCTYGRQCDSRYDGRCSDGPI